MNVDFRMNRSGYFFVFFALILALAFASCSGNVKEIVVVSEVEAVSGQIGRVLPYSCRVTTLGISDLKGIADWDFDILWLHDLGDSLDIGQDVVKAIDRYVRAGGKLILTSSAVRQLEYWGWDELHVREWTECHSQFALLPYSEHPLFERCPFDRQLKQFSGHEYTVYGFEYPSRVSMADPYVAAVPFVDGECLRDRKIIWEASRGSGRMLAIGAGLPFGYDWADGRFLKDMTSGLLSWIDDEESKKGSWEQDTLRVSILHEGHHVDCSICAAEFKAVKPPKPEFATMRKGSDLHSACDDFLEFAANDGLVLKAGERSGLEEILLDDMSLVKDYKVLLDIAGKDAIIPLSAYPAEVELFNNGFARHYRLDDTVISEYVSVCPDRPIAIIRYQWTGQSVRQLFTEHKCDLFRGYPYDGCMFSLVYSWSMQLNGTVVRSLDSNFCCVLGTNVPGRVTLCGQYEDVSYANWRVRGTVTDSHQVVSSAVYDVRGLNAVDVVIAGSFSGTEDMAWDYAEALRHPEAILPVL